MSATNIKRFKRCQWYYRTPVGGSIWRCRYDDGHEGAYHKEVTLVWTKDTYGAFIGITKTGKVKL